MDFLVNTIIDYFASNDEMSLAFVVKPGVERLQVQSAVKTEKITPRQILVSHGVANGVNLSTLSEILNAVNEARKEIEIDFLWENLLEKNGQLSVEDICKEYFGDTNPVNISALARVMLEDTVHFKHCVIEMKEDTERPDLRRMLAAFQGDPNGLPQRVIDLFI